MSKRKSKKERVRRRWLSLRREIDELFESIVFESFTQWKKHIEDELIRIVKKYNVLSWYGREWKVLTSLESTGKRFMFDVYTVNGDWRVYRYEQEDKDYSDETFHVRTV